MNSPFLQTYTGNITALLQTGDLCISDPDQLSEFILRLLRETTPHILPNQHEDILISCLEEMN